MASSIMLPASCANAVALETVIGTKRATHSLDGLNLKKRRKQSKPVRIASTEDSLSGEELIPGTNVNLSPINLIVSGNFRINSDVKTTPLNLSKQDEKEQIEERTAKTPNSDPDAESMYSKQNISPNNFISYQNLALNLTSHLGTDVSQVKCFNPEAFCDLCNKEFCNKYFLKTHRANKHRVYYSNINSDTLSERHSSSMNSLGSVPNLSISKPWSTKKSIQQINGSLNKSHLIKHPVNGISSTMRAICNICRKEFCNKYFVRRHKSKIHGIADTISESSSTEGKNCSEPSSHPNEGNQDSTNDSETFYDKENPWMGQSGSMKLTCSFCDEELPNGKALLDHLEEVHNNPDGELNSEENLVTSQVPCPFPLNVNKMDEKPIQESFGKNENYNQIYNPPIEEIPNVNDKQLSPILPFGPIQKLNLSSSIQNSVSPSKINKREHRSYPSKSSSPLNLALNYNETLSENEIVSHNCLICGEQFDSLYVLQNHLKIHHIGLTSNALGHQENHINESKSPSQCVDRSPVTPTTPTDKEKHAEDIKKLHKMIMEMNYTETTTCEICDIDCKTMYYLENHILKNHRVLMEEVSAIIEEDCNVFNQSKSKDQQENGRENANTPPDNLQMSSFCDICKKELCNKYFMKTHMQRMHGISIETGTHIGGVMCDICNKELCSKYFLRVHKQNSHGLIDDSLLPRLWVVDLMKNSAKEKQLKLEDTLDTTEKLKNFTELCPICNKKFRLAKWLRVHMCVEHGENIQDTNANLVDNSSSVRSNFLTTDLSNDVKPNIHSPILNSEFPSSTNGSTAEQPNFIQPKREVLNHTPESFQVYSSLLARNISSTDSKQYQCSKCPFTTTALAYLYVHERSHVQENSETFCCPICSLVLYTREALFLHFTIHENIHSIDIPSKLGETCWTAASDTDVIDNKSTENQDTDFSSVLSRVRETLLIAAKKLNNPLSFAVPDTQGSFVMQPFFLEPTQGSLSNEINNNFFSSLVYLPVKEKLSRPVSVSFKLTPP